jgi:hypothetical protein
VDPDLEHARIPLIRSWRSQERIRLPAGSRRYLSLGHLKVAATGNGPYTSWGRMCILSVLEGYFKARAKSAARTEQCSSHEWSLSSKKAASPAEPSFPPFSY